MAFVHVAVLRNHTSRANSKQGMSTPAVILTRRRPPSFDHSPQASLGVSPGITFESCSPHVGDVLGPDVMRSVEHLVPELLGAYPLLLYQGGARHGAAWAVWAEDEHDQVGSPAY